MSAENVHATKAMVNSTVTFGDVKFDPVATSDFRLSIEGTSNTGKSNTLAVLLEDLSDVTLPTLIIERLGALTPVRFEDENLIVVGARDEEGIDLPVALEELDGIGEWILDHGRKILLDISTYADFDSDKSREHLAAAVALQSLNDRAHERYRAGNRTKSLCVVDEAHILAPKDTAPEPELDDYVKRCRGQLIKAATEGGNKGISIVTAYQRRAFLHNGVIQLCADFVAHRPGDEDLPRTAKALRCDESTLAGLGTGEILAKGETITGSELVGPTKVRKRRSPDPREETFELPEASGETETFLKQIREEVRAERECRKERQDELDQLRHENERLQERVNELERELADTDRLASALENLPAGGGSVRDVGAGVEDLQERIEELKEDRERLEEERADLHNQLKKAEDERIEAEERAANQEAEIQELRTSIEQASEFVEQLAKTFDIRLESEEIGDDVDGTSGVNEENEIEKLRRENEQLRSRINSLEGSAIPSNYREFVNEDVVQEAIEDAKNHAKHTSPRYVRGVVASILEEGGPVNYESIAKMLDVSDTSNIGKAATALEKRGVIKKVSSRPVTVDFDLESIDELRKQNARRKQARSVLNDL